MTAIVELSPLLGSQSTIKIGSESPDHPLQSFIERELLHRTIELFDLQFFLNGLYDLMQGVSDSLEIPHYPNSTIQGGCLSIMQLLIILLLLLFELCRDAEQHQLAGIALMQGVITY